MSATPVPIPPAPSGQVPALATPDGFPGGRPGMHIFSNQDGLPQNSILSLTTDQKGYLWAGTQDGATCYNGHRWTTVNMPNRMRSNYVRTVYAASDGSIWFGTTGNGAIRLQNGNWTTFTTETGAVPTDNVFCFEEVREPAGNSVLWVGTSGGLATFENNQWKTLTPENSGLPHKAVNCLLKTKAVDGSAVVWVGTSGGLARLAQGKWTAFTTGTSPLPHNQVLSLLETTESPGKQALWIGTAEGGLAKIHDDQWTVFDPQQTGLLKNRVLGLVETIEPDQTRTLWVGSYGSGLVRYQNGRWVSYNRQTSALPNDAVMSLYKSVSPDGAYTIWAGTINGLARLRSGTWTTYVPATAGTANNVILSLLETQSVTGQRVLWLGTAGGGLARLENGQWTSFTTQNSGLPNNRVLCLLQSRDPGGGQAIWMGMNGGGLACLRGNQWTVYTTENSKLPSNLVWSLAQTVDADGTPVLWVVTAGGGVVRIKGTNWTVLNHQNSGLPSDEVLVLVATKADDGSQVLWLGTDGKGLVRFHNNQWTVFDTQNSGLANNFVWSLCEAMGSDGHRTLWIGTGGGGVSVFDPTSTGLQWRTISDQNLPGFPNNTINQICQDQQHRMYLFTNRGVARLTPKRLRAWNPDEFSLYTFTTDDGLPSNECNQGAAMVDRNGCIWAGTLEGAAMLDPGTEFIDRSPKQLLIERILLNGKLFEGSPNGVPQNAIFEYNENNLVFEYALLSYFREAETRYQTQLVNFDEQRSEWKIDTKKEYTSLPDGNYTFQVWARDYAGNISGPVTATFRVLPAPWRTIWAYFFYAGVIFGIGYAIYSWRVQALRRRQAEKVAHLRQLQEERIAHLHQLQEERISSLRHLLESIRVINLPLDLNTVLQNIAQESAQLIEGEPGGIGLIEGEQVVFRRLWMRDHWVDEPLVFQFGEGVAGRVAATATPMLVNDSEHSDEIAFHALIKKFDVLGMMDVPIISRTGKVVGVLDVRRPAGRLPFTQADCQLIESLAHQAAVAIEKAALYGELERLYNQERDVTRRLQELDQMKTNFLIITSHEIRTPLTVLKGYSEALLDEYLGPLTKAQKRSLLTCQRMIDRMVITFNDILEMLKINEGNVSLKVTTFDLSAAIQEILVELSPFIDQRNQTFLKNIPESITLVGDIEKIQLVLINIIQNAIKFTYDGGEVQVTLVQELDTIHLSIKDSGIGIDPEEIEQIFEKFYTTPDPSTHTSGRFEFSARGTGLGLAIAKSYVEAHGGRIWAESIGKGHGSCFHIVLPLVYQENGAEEYRAEESGLKTSG
ncbi:MAG: GAF domain-containing protein [Acidobacteria bacterium]|nr:GAF domain-containing protein [Acidobacteriota bacterium]